MTMPAFHIGACVFFPSFCLAEIDNQDYHQQHQVMAVTYAFRCPNAIRQSLVMDGSLYKAE